jgi:hypothetical protein
MRKVFLSVLLGLSVAASVYAVNDMVPGTDKPTGSAPTPATKPIGNQNMPQVVKESISPTVTINEPDQNEVWEEGESHTVGWETRFCLRAHRERLC